MIEGTVNPDGRVCIVCNEFKDWNEFKYRFKGFNKHTASCKICLEKRLIGINRSKISITQSVLKDAMDYDPATGIFIRKITMNCKALKGQEVGYLNPEGYRLTKLYGTCYSVHRLAWLYVYGYDPENEIDHINGIRDDNRICNLREATRQCNMRNTGVRKDNKSGVTGIYKRKGKDTWIVYLRVNCKPIYIGEYLVFDDAVINRYKAERVYNYSECIAKTSAHQYLIDNNLMDKVSI